MLYVSGEKVFRLSVADHRVNDNVVAFAPVSWCCYLVFISKLEGYIRVSDQGNKSTKDRIHTIDHPE